MSRRVRFQKTLPGSDKLSEQAGAQRAPDSYQGAVPLVEQRRIAEAIREACLRVAVESYERAGLSGLCDEGRWEVAADAMRTLDLEVILRALDSPGRVFP